MKYDQLYWKFFLFAHKKTIKKEIRKKFKTKEVESK